MHVCLSPRGCLFLKKMVIILFVLGFAIQRVKIYMGYWPSVGSRWRDIGLVLFLRVYVPRPRLGP